ncbi:MAG: putative membrane protein [Flavobacteriales bacterium]|jgi:uncharacterized membrane protein
MDEITYNKNRVVNFSDAVFSIVMTLLILEVAVPTSQELSTTAFGEVLSNRIPAFIGLLVSFLVSALYWLGHLKIMKYVSEFDNKLLWLNIFFLLSVVLLPFSTAMYVNGFGLAGPFIFYCLNLTLIGVFNLLMMWYIYRKEPKCNGFHVLIYKWYRSRGINVVAVWIIAAICALIFPGLSRFIFMMLFINQIFIDRYYKKKMKRIV